MLFIHLTEPRTNYVVQVLAYNEAGEGESAQQQTFTEEDITPALDSELMAPLEVKVRVISPTSVMVTWYDSTLGQNQKNQDDRIYTVKYNALSGLSDNLYFMDLLIYAILFFILLLFFTKFRGLNPVSLLALKWFASGCQACECSPCVCFFDYTLLSFLLSAILSSILVSNL